MKEINTPDAPQAVGPYSQAQVVGEWVFCSGQLGLNPTTGRLESIDDVAIQTRQALKNLQAVLRAAGSDLSRVVKTTVFVTDMGDFPVVNRVYAETFGEHRPARATVEVAGLPLDGRVEIEAVATLQGDPS